MGRDIGWHRESISMAEHTDCVLSVRGIDHCGIPGIRAVHLHAVLKRDKVKWWRTRSASPYFLAGEIEGNAVKDFRCANHLFTSWYGRAKANGGR